MSWLSNIFGGGGNKNPANAGMSYLNQIPGQTSQYMQPYYQAGVGALPGLQEQYANLLNDPGAFMNKIGESYQQSPGFQSAMEQALAAGNHASAAGGMAGTPADQFQQMQMATNLSNQDYNNWLSKTIGLYGQGLSGEQGMAGMGQQAGQELANMIAQTLAQQGNMAFRGQQEKNSMNNSWLGGLGRIGGAALGGLAGGPWGAFTGWNMSR
jgi:hypothetical protein